MHETHQKQTLRSRVLRTDTLPWRQLQFIQQDDFKELSPDARNRLRASILANDFTQPFYVWQEPGTDINYCLDGKHRVLILHDLEKEGYDIPDLLPATLMFCEDKKDAARLVLIYSSMYARVTEAGLAEFASMYELDMPDIVGSLNIPEINWDSFLADANRDFSLLNHELDTEEFKDEVVLKLTFSKADYISVKKNINDLLIEKRLLNAEELIKNILSAYAS